MSAEVKHVHVGAAIEERRKQLKISKTEFGRRIGVTQQHVNRILERETMETKRLVMVSEALDFNFFSLFCSAKQQISAYLSAVALEGGKSQNLIGDAVLVGELEKEKISNEGKDAKIELLENQIEQLRSQLKDKDMIIELLKKERR